MICANFAGTALGGSQAERREPPTREKDMTMTAITRSIGVSAGIAALAATVACGTREAGTTAVQAAGSVASAPNGVSPVMVTCEPNQRTLVRPVVVNGTSMSQVECVSVAAAPAQLAETTYAPANTVRTTPVNYDLAPARVVQPDQPATIARPIPARQVVYRDDVRDEVRARPKRSVAKRAVIIGTTAGASAGIGALMGGKKGALIGAAVGGGGATVWDQVTRRQNR
jgi:hypothetical protein